MIPDSVTTIGYDAFYDCRSLTSVTLGDNVTTIGSSAFYDCDSLKSVTIGKNVTSIGKDAFYGCGILSEAYYKGDITGWCEITFNENVYANPLYYADSLYIDDKLVSGELIIPNGTKTISDFAFWDYDNLTSVTISDSVLTIGYSAFNDCDNLTSVIIGSGVDTIEKYAFYSCDRLNNVTFKDISTWYRTGEYKDCKDKISGTQITVTNTSQNAEYLRYNYDDYYWYKN